jgi:hypothetical protein
MAPAMNAWTPEAGWAELPEFLGLVRRMTGQVEDISRCLLGLVGYLPAGSLENDESLRRTYDMLREILEPEADSENAGHGSLSGGYPAASPSSKG